jgi:hypothetical protein
LARFDPKKEFRQVRRLEPNRQNRLSWSNEKEPGGY